MTMATEENNLTVPSVTDMRKPREVLAYRREDARKPLDPSCHGQHSQTARVGQDEHGNEFGTCAKILYMEWE